MTFWTGSVTSKPSRLFTNFMTLMLNLTFTELQVSIKDFVAGLAFQQGLYSWPLKWEFLRCKDMYHNVCRYEYLGQMYPPELEIKDTTESNTSASYLDLLLSIGRDGQLRTSLYDKRDDFNFHITNFPFLSSNIPSSPAYGVFVSQLIRYARACSSYECFILRAMRLSNKLLGQGYVKERLKSSLRKFYGRYGDLTKQYEVPLSRMLHDILDDDHIQWHPPLIGHYTNFRPLLIWTLLPNLTFYLIVQGFHRAYATGAACQQRTLTPPDTWSCHTLGLACVLMSRPISPELVLSPDFWISNTPRYFSFAFNTSNTDPFTLIQITN